MVSITRPGEFILKLDTFKVNSTQTTMKDDIFKTFPTENNSGNWKTNIRKISGKWKAIVELLSLAIYLDVGLDD